MNAVGKRYLVESWKSDDGRSWFNRYSDGLIEQGGQTSTNGETTFPIPFESIVLSVDRTNNWGRAATAANELGTSISSITLTGISMSGVSGNTFWRAEGY
nr:MAG TPA: putative tail fiber protein [Caudoviricetes sp.]